VELEPGVEGLVHVTELSWTKRIAKPADVLKADQEVEAVVLGINREEQKISLGIRQLETNPWDKGHGEIPAHTKVKGKIRNLTSYGAFIELEEGLDGMIHVSDISWTRKINHPSEVFKKGDEVEAVVLEVDKANQRIAVGVKQLTVDPWSNIDQYYKMGDLVTGKVTKLASFGAFVGLQHEIDGLVHISQVSEERTEKIKNVLKVGQEVTARVIKIDKRRPAHRSFDQSGQLLQRAAQGRAGHAGFAQTGRRPRGPAARLRRRRRRQIGRLNPPLK
jgi:small subunit ribosomal protein S1